MSKTNKILSLEITRILASFMIVLAHTSAEGWYYTDLHSDSWMAMNVYDSFARIGLPLFFMISGAAILAKQEITVRYTLRKTSRLLAIYFIFYIFYTCGDIGFNGVKNPLRILERMITVYKPCYHLWYLIDLSLIYLLLPFIHNEIKTQNRKTIHYYLLLFVIFSVFLPSLSSLSFISPVLKSYIRPFLALQGLGYIGYFVLGWYLSGIPLEGKNKKLSVLILLIAVIGSGLATAFITRAISIKTGEPDERYYTAFSLFVFLEAISFFMLIRFITDKINGNEKLINLFSSGTLFVYLIHPFLIIECKRHLNLLPSSYNLWISLPLISLAIWIIGEIMGIITKKIPVINKLL